MQRAVERIANVQPAEFRTRFLAPGRPVIVTDGFTVGSGRRWSPGEFRDRFGELNVSLSGDFFSEHSRSTLREYIDLVERYELRHLSEFDPLDQIPYLRLAYPGVGTDDFSASFFEALREEWSRPYFLPKSLYLNPFDLSGTPPNVRRYPEWGIFISPKGASTALHVDRTQDNAILAVASGRKAGVLFEPSIYATTRMHTEHWAREAGTLPPKTADALMVLNGMLPDYGDATPWHFELGPGEVLFIPKRWPHEVFTVSACVTLTYNFIHLADLDWTYIRSRLRNIFSFPVSGHPG